MAILSGMLRGSRMHAAGGRHEADARARAIPSVAWLGRDDDVAGERELEAAAEGAPFTAAISGFTRSVRAGEAAESALRPARLGVGGRPLEVVARPRTRARRCR
jgi:hypothetical protein